MKSCRCEASQERDRYRHRGGEGGGGEGGREREWEIVREGGREGKREGKGEGDGILPSAHCAGGKFLKLSASISEGSHTAPLSALQAHYIDRHRCRLAAVIGGQGTKLYSSTKRTKINLNTDIGGVASRLVYHVDPGHHRSHASCGRLAPLVQPPKVSVRILVSGSNSLQQLC
jgi:hypothetical protein